MATQTTNLGLTKPSYDEHIDVDIINDNMDKIDGGVLCKVLSPDCYGLELPEAGVQGRIFFKVVV